MPKTSKNQLTIAPLLDEKGIQKINGAGLPVFRLFGYINGEKVRAQSTKIVDLELIKKTKEDAADAAAKQLAESIGVRQTWLDTNQLRDAEAAYRRLPTGRTLFECVEAADSILGTGDKVGCEKSLTDWEAKMKIRGLAKITVSNNLQIARSFLRGAKIEFLHEATPKKLEDFIRNPQIAAVTQLSLAGRLHTWFEFCVREKWIKKNPVELDMSEMRERARPVNDPDILTPTQAQALLAGAAESNKPALVFLVICGLWCFMRKAEIHRLTRENLVIRNVKGEPVTVTIHARGHKLGSKWRNIPVPSNVAGLLIDSIERGAFDEDTKRVPFSEWDWKHLRAKAGMLKITYRGDKPREPIITDSEWTPNVMRHTGMSYLFQETNGDIDLVTKRAGNSEDVAFMHYLRNAEPNAYKAFNAVTASFPATVVNGEAVA